MDGEDGRGGATPADPARPSDAARADRDAPATLAEHYRTSDYALFPQEHRTGGTLGVTMMEVEQGAIETTDPAIPQTSFVGFLGADDKPGEVDFGDGWREGRWHSGIVDPQPAHTECRLRIPAVHLLALAIDHAALAARLDEAGAGVRWTRSTARSSPCRTHCARCGTRGAPWLAAGRRRTWRWTPP